MHDYLAAVLGRDISGNGDTAPTRGDWRQWLTEEFLTRSGRIDQRGAIIYRGEDRPTAFVTFLSVEDARRQYGDRDWFTLQHPCPWTHGVVGFLAWTNASPLPPLSSTAFPGQVIEICCGRVAYLPLDEYRDPIVEVSIPLSAFRRLRYGFERASLLSFDRRYLDAVTRDVNDALRRIGIGTPVAVMEGPISESKGITPIQFVVDEDYPLVDLDGRQVSNAEALLEKHFIRIWGFDTQLLRGTAGFWWTR